MFSDTNMGIRRRRGLIEPCRKAIPGYSAVMPWRIPATIPCSSPVGRDSHLVTADNGPRPAGPPDACFYCRQSIGTEHKPDCVLRQKWVRLAITFDVLHAEPEDWDQQMIEFARNEGTWCSDNAVEMVEEATKYRYEHDGNCMCRSTQIRYMGEGVVSEDGETVEWPDIENPELADFDMTNGHSRRCMGGYRYGSRPSDPQPCNCAKELYDIATSQAELVSMLKV